MTLVGSNSVDAGSVITYVLIALTLVNIDAGIPVSGQLESLITNTLERALQVVAYPVVAYSGSFVAFVDVHTIPPTEPKLVTRRTKTLEVTLLIDTLGIVSAGTRYLMALVIVNALV